MLRLNLPLLMQLGFTRADVETLRVLLERSGISDAAITPQDNQMQFEEEPLTSPEAMKALREAEDLRNEMQYIRGDVQAIRSLLDDLQSAIADSRGLDQLRSRIESIEDRLA